MLPAAAKVSKVPPHDLAAFAPRLGQDVSLWDGPASHIAASLNAGADGVVTAPLSHAPEWFPAPEVTQLQAAIDTAQHHLDRQLGRGTRTTALFAMAVRPTASDGASTSCWLVSRRRGPHDATCAATTIRCVAFWSVHLGPHYDGDPRGDGKTRCIGEIGCSTRNNVIARLLDEQRGVLFDAWVPAVGQIQDSRRVGWTLGTTLTRTPPPTVRALCSTPGAATPACGSMRPSAVVWSSGSVHQLVRSPGWLG